MELRTEPDNINPTIGPPRKRKLMRHERDELVRQRLETGLKQPSSPAHDDIDRRRSAGRPKR
jgi:hypothetical protein